MKKRAILLVALLLAITGLCVWRFSSPPPERLFRGKPESEWIRGLSYNNQAQIQQWRDFGPEGVKILVRGLQKANRPLDRLYRKVYRRMLPMLRHVLPAPREDFTRPTRMTLCALLAQLSPGDMVATPMMTAELRDEDPAVRTLAITFFTYGEGQNALLNKLGKEEKQSLLPFFIADMGKSTASVRNNAAVALGYYPEEAPAIVPILVKALKDADPHVAKVAANTLKKIDPDAAAQVGVK